MSSLQSASVRVVYNATQEIDVAYIVSLLEGDYNTDELVTISVESYDVIVKTKDGKEHRLEGIIPTLILNLPRPERLELWDNGHRVQSSISTPFNAGKPVLSV